MRIRRVREANKVALEFQTWPMLWALCSNDSLPPIKRSQNINRDNHLKEETVVMGALLQRGFLWRWSRIIIIIKTKDQRLRYSIFDGWRVIKADERNLIRQQLIFN